MGALLLRADAGSQIGMGHVMRCLALAEPWLQAGSAVTLLTAAPSSALRARAESLGVSLSELTAAPGTPADAAETIALAQSLCAAWLVLDGYHFDADFQRAAKAAGLRLLVFDDMGQVAHYSADFILNQNLGAKESLYPHRERTTRLLLGPRFVQLRREFTGRSCRRGEADHDRIGNPPPHFGGYPRVLVTLGGSDPDNVTAHVVAILQTIPNLTADIILGPANPHAATLQSALGNRSSAITVHQNPPDLPQLMSRADLAICAGGTTAWELSSLGVPMLVLVLAENQRTNAEQLVVTGAAIHTDLTALAGNLRMLLADPALRAKMSARARTLVDGRGVARVASAMQGYPLSARMATPDDARLLWEWVNDPDVRASAFNMAPIAWEEHLAWFTRRLADANCALVIVSDETGTPVGQVRFEGEGATATVDISLAPAARGRGLSARALKLGVGMLFDDPCREGVRAWVKTANTASQKAFERAGFRRIGEKKMHGQKAVGYHLGRNDLR